MRRPHPRLLSEGVGNARFSFGRKSVPRRTVQFNEYGFNDLAHPLIRSASGVRVAVIGDSFVEAKEVAFSERATAVLAAKTAFADSNLQVMNFGVAGYGWSQYLQLLILKVLQFDPDVVLIVSYGNDIAEDLYYAFFRKKLADKAGKIAGVLSRFPFLQQLPVVRLINERIYHYLLEQAAQEYVGASGLRAMMSCFEKGDSARECCPESPAAIYGIKRELTNRGIPWGVVYLPLTAEVSPRHRGKMIKMLPEELRGFFYRGVPEVIHESMIKVLRQENIRTLDLSSRIRAALRDGQNVYFSDDEHLTNEGQMLLADGLAVILAEVMESAAK